MSWICKPQACLQYLSSDLSWLKQCCIAEGKLSSRTTSFAPFLDTFYCSFDAFYVAGFWLQGHLQPVHAHKTGRIIAVINPVARVPYSAHVFVRKRAFFMHSLCTLHCRRSVFSNQPQLLLLLEFKLLPASAPPQTAERNGQALQKDVTACEFGAGC